MRLFYFLYNKVIGWSSKSNAIYYLAGLAFAESSFFPVPPDVMLISMGLAKPKKSWLYALVATIFSVIGGMFGYLLGALFSEIAVSYLSTLGYNTLFLQVQHWFLHWGIWVIFLAGFTPIPYKIFTIAAGVMLMPFVPFVLSSLLGRSGRFFLVAFVMYFAGEKMHEKLQKYVELIGWMLIFVLVIIYIYFNFYRTK